MTDYAIEAVRLTKRFGAVTAVDDISFTVRSGTVTGLLGGNGAGKTTTISMLLGRLLPTSGSVRVLGVDMVRNRHAVLSRVNFSSPSVELPPRLTVRENLAVYAHLYGVLGARQRIAELAGELDFVSMLDRPAGALSASQKTRVALAKALISRPKVLVLDEPTASLDPDTADGIRTYLERYHREAGATILLASHNMAEVERMCGEVLMLRGGRIVDQGEPAELLRRFGRSTLEEVFFDIIHARRPNDDVAATG